MRTHFSRFKWIIAATLLIFAGCGNPAGPNVTPVDTSPILFLNLTADGSVTETTPSLTMTLSRDIPDLTPTDISISKGSTGVIRGNLNHIGKGIYTLLIGGISEPGEITVTVDKPGFTITNDTKNVDIYYNNQPKAGDISVDFLDLETDGIQTATTSKLILYFNKDIDGLSADNIFVEPVSSDSDQGISQNTENLNNGIITGPLTQIGTGIYELGITGINSSGEIRVAAAKPGYYFNGEKTTDVIYTNPAKFISLDANGSVYEATTNLTLTFDKDIGDISIDDIIYFNAGDTGALIKTTGNMVHTSGSCQYSLEITGVKKDGDVAIDVITPGYSLSGGPLSVPVFFAEPLNLTVDQNGVSGAVMTTLLTLTLDKDIQDLSNDEIILSGNTGASKGELTKVPDVPGVYELEVTGITASGRVTVTITREGYTIATANRYVYYYVYIPPVQAVLEKLEANGSLDSTTTKLILTFDQDIIGLTEADIELNSNETEATKGILTKTPGQTGVYELALNDVNNTGDENVSISRNGYDFGGTGGSANGSVTIYRETANWIGIAGNGSMQQSTSVITLTFDKDINDLTADAVTITPLGTADVTMSINTVRRTGLGVYELAVNITSSSIVPISRNIRISIGNTKYIINSTLNNQARTITLYYYAAPQNIQFNKLTADGSTTETTSKLTLTFSQDISGLTANDITLTANGVTAQKEQLVPKGAGVYELGISGITVQGLTAGWGSGLITITMGKAGYTFTPGSLSVNINQYIPPVSVSFLNLTADGFDNYLTGQTSGSLILTFNQQVANLDSLITFDNGGTGAVKGTLSGTNPYTLKISNVTTNGSVTVKLANNDEYAFDPASRSVDVIHYAPPAGISFLKLEADGSDGSGGTQKTTTTKLTLTFSPAIGDLSAGDITLTANNTGAEKGSLENKGAGVYDLWLNNISASGQVSVTVDKTGYIFTPVSQNANIYLYTPPKVIQLTNLTANGFDNYLTGQTTSELTFTLSQPIADPNALTKLNSYITLDDGGTGAVKGILSGTNPYTLGITGINKNGSVTVTLNGDDNYAFDPASRSVDVIKYTAPVNVSFSNLTADGSTTETTTKLTLTFDRDITGLSANDISLTTSGVSVKKGQLNPTGSGVYELGLSEVTVQGLTSGWGSGVVTVAVNKTGFIFTPQSLNVNVNHYIPPAAVLFTELRANGSNIYPGGSTTSQLYLTFDKAFTETNALSVLNGLISLDDGGTGAVKGALSGANPYTLEITNVNTSGSVTVKLANNTDYVFDPASRSADVVKYVPPAEISFTGLTADGSSGIGGAQKATTTKLILAFSKDIDSLTADDITLTSSGVNVKKGQLISRGSGIYELGLSEISIPGLNSGAGSGSVTLNINKTGFVFTPISLSTNVYQYIPPASVSFMGLTADGIDNYLTGQTSSSLTLSFSQQVANLDSLITFDNGGTGAIKGTLSGTNPYTLNISNVTANGSVTIKMTDNDNYAFTPSSRVTDVIKYTPPVNVSFTKLTADGTDGSGGLQKATTTKLTLTLSQDFNNLSANDITLTANNTGAKKGALTSKGNGVYELQLTDITASGSITVTINKTGFVFNPAGLDANIYLYIPPASVDFQNLTANGLDQYPGGSTTTEVVLTLGRQVDNLNDLIVLDSGSTGAVKGDLSGSNPYTLKINNVTASGPITVNLQNNDSYIFSPSGRTVNVSKYTPPAEVSLMQITADGNANLATTGKLTLTFSQDITDLTAADISMDDGDTGAVKGSLTRISAGIYELGLSGITKSGEITIEGVTKTGFNIGGTPQSVPVFYVTPAIFNTLAADGSLDLTTTKLTLTFDRDIIGLSASDIVFTPGTTGAVKESLSRITTGVYELGLSGITATGDVTVNVSKAGYNISGNIKTAKVFIYTAAITNVTQSGSETSTTTKLTLTLDKSIDSLTSSNIIFNNGGTGAAITAINRTGDSEFEILLGGITSKGTVSINVSKPGYYITGGPVSVTIFYVANVAFTGLSANGGSRIQTTDTLTLTFDKDIDGLSAADIILLPGITGASAGTLTKRAASTGIYDLKISGLIRSGAVNVNVSKVSFNITGNPPNANVYVAYPVAFTALNQDGTLTKMTTRFTLTFDRDINDSWAGNLTADDITLTAGNTGVTKVNLTKVYGSTGVYDLSVTGINASGNVEVNVSKEGYAITPGSLTQDIFYAESVSFNGLSADGTSETATTTKLTLSFDKDIANFGTQDITFSPGTTGASMGDLSRTGTGVYTLTLTGISSAGQVSVDVSKSGYDISGGPRTAMIYINTVAFNSLSQDGGTTKTTRTLTLSFNKDITGLGTQDIAFTPVNTGATLGDLTRTGTGVYSLTLTGVRESGTVSVTVKKASYLINNAARSVDIFYAIPVTFSSLTGNDTATTPLSILTFTFDQDISGLTADNISLTPGPGISVTKGNLTKVNGKTGVYELEINVGVVSSTQTSAVITAAVTKPGYELSGSLTVNARIPRTFTGLQADGSSRQTTSSLKLTFDMPITGLSASDITLDPGSTGAIKGTLTGTGTTYNLALSGINVGGPVSVTVIKNGYSISSANQSVNVNYAIPVTFNTVTADGSGFVTTSKLTLSFSGDIFNLNVDDITLTPNSTGAVKGSLAKTGTGVYELTLSGIRAGGQITVAVSKDGYEIGSASKNVSVNYAAPRTFTGLTQNGQTTVSTTKLTLSFDSVIAGLTASDITLNSGITGAVKGTTLTQIGSSSTYDLPISGITKSGTVTVNVSKTGFAISGGPVSVLVYAVGSAPFNIGFDVITDALPVIPGPVLYRISNNGPVTQTITLDNPGQYDANSIRWQVEGTDITETGVSFTLDASNSAYNYLGDHFLTLFVTRNGVPYNKTISFTIEY